MIKLSLCYNNEFGKREKIRNCSRLSILIVKKKRNFGAFLALKEF